MLPSVLTRPQYAALYAHRFLTEVSWAPAYVLLGTFLIQTGSPLWMVLLFYGLEFGLRGFLTAWMPQVTQKIGIGRVVILANLFQTAFLFALVWGAATPWIVFAVMPLYAISGALYYPYSDILEAAYVDNSHRGVQFAITSGVVGVAGTLGFAGFAALAGVASTGWALVIFGLLMPLSAVPLAALDFSKIHMTPTTPRQAFAELNSETVRPMIFSMVGQQLVVVCNFVTIPLFIYHAVGDVEGFGLLMAATLFINTVICIALGRHADRFGQHRSAGLISGSNIFGSVLYLIIPPNVRTLLGLESFNRIAYTALNNSYTTHIHRMLVNGKQDLLRFSVAWQMVFCFAELITVPLLALAAYFWGWEALKLGFVLNIIGVAMVATRLMPGVRVNHGNSN